MDALCVGIKDEKDYRQFERLLQELNELLQRKERRFPQRNVGSTLHRNKPWKAASGVAQKVTTENPEMVEIVIEQAQELFREVRIENTFIDVDGTAVALKRGARVEVTFEADAKDTVRKV